MVDTTDEEWDDEEWENAVPSKETYRKLIEAFELQDLEKVEELLQKERATDTKEVQDKLLELANTNVNEVEGIFKLFDKHNRISQEFLRR